MLRGDLLRRDVVGAVSPSRRSPLVQERPARQWVGWSAQWPWWSESWVSVAGLDETGRWQCRG